MRGLPTFLLLLWTVGSASSVRAQTSWTPPPLSVLIQREDVHLNEDFYRACVTEGTNKFAFFLPEGFRLNNNPTEGAIKLINREGSCKLTFAIIAPVPENPALNPETYRVLLLEQHPDAKIQQEFARGVAGYNGPAFDLEWRGPAGTMQAARVLFVPSPFGVLEFLSVSATDNVPLMQSSFNRIIGSFSISRDGKFEVIHGFSGS